MSSQKSSGQTKYANSNLNGVFAKSSTTGPSTSGGVGFKTLSGMLVLQKKTRTSTAAAGTKLSVPKPVNLPSMKKEHAGNDPTTQLVPSGGTGSGWVKPEEPPAPPPPEPRQSSLTAGSVWASTPRSASSVPWQPPRDTVPVAARGPSFPVDRHLNPEEYPSLAATAKAQTQAQFKAAGRSGLEAQDTKSWADDERGVPHASFRGSPADWSRDERFDDERGMDKASDFSGRSAWDIRERPSSRYDYDYAAPPPPPRGAAFDDEYDFRPRGTPSFDYGRGPYDSSQPPPPPGRRYGPPSGDRFHEPFFDGGRPHLDTFDDRGLFPPPPPPKPAGFREGHGSDQQEESEDVDLERQAFEAELARVAADLEKKKADDKEAELQRAKLAEEPAIEEEVKEEVPEPIQIVPPPPPPPPPQAKRPEPAEPPQQKEPELTPEQLQEKAQAAKAAAAAKAKAVKEAAEAEERRRKEAAAQKLRELEERIAQRKAEEAAKEAAAAKAAAAALQPPKHAAASSSEHAEEDWEKVQDAVDVKKPSTPTGSQPATASSTPPTSSDISEQPPQVPTQQVPASTNAWQQPLQSVAVPPARFGSFDDTLLANISKSASDQAAEQPSTGQPQTSANAALEAGKEAEASANGSRDTWRSDAREEFLEDAGQRGRGGRGDRGRSGRGDRGRGRGRGLDGGYVETDRPGSAQRSRFESGSDMDAPGRNGRGRGRTSSRGGRGGRANLPAQNDDAATAAAMAAATAAVAAATASVGDDKRSKLDSPVEQLTPRTTQPQEDAPAPPPAPATAAVSPPAAEPPVSPTQPAVDNGDSKGRRPAKFQRESQTPPAAQAAAVKVPGIGGRGPAPPRADKSRGPSPVPGFSQPVANAPTQTTVTPAHPGAPQPSGGRMEQRKQQPDISKAPLNAAANSSAPQNIPQRRPASSADSAAFGWDNSIAKDVASMTLDDPVVNDTVHLPVSLDPTPPKQTAPILNPGFERQIGPRHMPKDRRHDMSDDPLDNRIPPLPTEILDGLPSPQKVVSLPFAPPVPSGMNMRPLGPGFAFPPTSDASPNPAAPGGHLSAMWGQPLSFGQPLHQQPNLAAAAVEAWNMPLPMHSSGPLAMNGNPSSSTPNIPAPPALMINMGQFGQFGQHFTPPGPYNAPTQFGTLAQGFQYPSSQPPFVPTGKQPDWSTGPGPMGIGSQTNPIGPGLRPGMLDSLLPFGNIGAAPQGSDAYRTAGLGPQGMVPLGPPGAFPPPPKPHPQEHSMRPAGAAAGAGTIGQHRDGHGHNQKVQLPDDLTFGMEVAANAPKPPPGLSIHQGSRATHQQLQAAQHAGQQPMAQAQHQQPPVQHQQQPGARPTSARPGRGPNSMPPERGPGRGGVPQRAGRGPSAPGARRPGGPGPSSNGGPAAGPPPGVHVHGPAAPPTMADRVDAAPPAASGNQADGEGANRLGPDGGRGGGRGQRGRASGARGSRAPPNTKTMYVPKGNYSNGSGAPQAVPKDK